MIDNKDIIIERLSNLNINENNKKQYGEVFTPRPLINEMLDKLPKEVWSNKELKWFDPAVGIGNFMIEIYWRLMDNIDISDLNERKSHILSNMLYMSELNEENIKECKKIFNEEINIYEGDTLQMPDDYFPIDKFDIIVGNPPYNEAGVIKKNRGVSLWTKFVIKSFNMLKDDGYLLFITPISWMGSPKILKEFLKREIIYLNINECRRHFRKVGSTFSYYLIRNKNVEKQNVNVLNEYKNKIYAQKVKFENNLEFLPRLLTSEVISIQRKLFVNKDTGFLRKDREYQKLDVNEKVSSIYKYPIKIKYNKTVYSSAEHLYQNNLKVLLFRAGNLNPTFDNGENGVGADALCKVVNSVEEGLKLVNLYKSKLFTFLIKVTKYSGYNNQQIINLMYMDVNKLTNNFTDYELYDYFKLTEDEIKYIENIEE